MRKLKRRDIDAVRAVLLQRKTRVSNSKLWQYLHDELAVGRATANGGHFDLTSSDRYELRSYVLSHTGLDPLVTPLPEKSADRIDVAGVSSDEKLSTRVVSQDYILVTSAVGRVVLHDSECSLPQGSALWLNWRQLALSAGQKVIFVENMAAFLNWYKANLPLELRAAVAVYRGHDKVSRAVRAFAGSIDQQQSVAANDYDPAGLAMAREQGAGFMLVPESPDQFLQQRDGWFNKPSAFHDQYQQHESNHQWVSGETRQLWRWMETNGSSITQEAMLEAEETLKLVRL